MKHSNVNISPEGKPNFGGC